MLFSNEGEPTDSQSEYLIYTFENNEQSETDNKIWRRHGPYENASDAKKIAHDFFNSGVYEGVEIKKKRYNGKGEKTADETFAVLGDSFDRTKAKLWTQKWFILFLTTFVVATFFVAFLL